MELIRDMRGAGGRRRGVRGGGGFGDHGQARVRAAEVADGGEVFPVVVPVARKKSIKN
jgi:hypothetical protein